MKKNISRSILAAAVLMASNSGFAAPEQVAGYPEGFTTEAKLIGTNVCDAGATKLEIYEGPHEGASSVGPYQWIFVSKDGVIRFWIFVPNPKSMSPVVVNYAKDQERFKEISPQERDAVIEKEMPALWALSKEKAYESDCVFTKIPHE